MFHFAICHKTQREGNNRRRRKKNLIQIINTNFPQRKRQTIFFREVSTEWKKYWNKFEILSFEKKKSIFQLQKQY